MEAAFAWLGQIFEALLKFFPRVTIVRATHAGVKWRWGYKVLPMNPGLHVWWPLVTDIEVVPIARQTISLPVQVQTTKDGKKAVIGTIVVYRIYDIVSAIGKRNWDVDSTVNDISQGAIARVIATHTFDEIMQGMADGSIVKRLTHGVRRELRSFGIRVMQAKIVDLAECRVWKLVTNDNGHRHQLGMPLH
jgi:regulator of protease activity HflC (stomatin/prohibitin superfamily)